jgi:predicted N-acetyltransferase YhbS
MCNFKTNDDQEIIIRIEEESDFEIVEKITRDAFYNEEYYKKTGVGCTEHYMVHMLRNTEAINELTFVAEVNNEVVGHVIYSKSPYIELDSKERLSVITFGPISVSPKYQKQGVGSALMKHSIARAKGLGYKAIVFYGHPTYYPRFGFVVGKTYNIRTAGGEYIDPLMAMELKEGYLSNISGKFHESELYDEKYLLPLALEFDKKFR